MADGSIDFDLGTGGGMLYSRFGCFEQRCLEWVGGFVEYDCKAHMIAGDAYVVGDHVEFDYIFTRAGIAYRGEGIGYQRRIQIHSFRKLGG